MTYRERIPKLCYFVNETVIYDCLQATDGFIVCRRQQQSMQWLLIFFWISWKPYFINASRVPASYFSSMK